MEEVGRVSSFFAHPSVAVVDLTAPLKVGDTVYLKGHTTDFQQTVDSMQIDRAPVQEAQAGASVGLQVKERCRKHDVVYKLVA
ncbi:MAG: translation elongation factor-like protein [Candidatus Omnitrophica bacterium]|nr:translation elongation factor-like protein [Candidatus Omnitrophota bacterium]